MHPKKAVTRKVNIPRVNILVVVPERPLRVNRNVFADSNPDVEKVGENGPVNRLLGRR